MKVIKYPNQELWGNYCKRPTILEQDLSNLVSEVFEKVSNQGDKAVLEFAQKFDFFKGDNLRVSEQEINSASAQIKDELKKAIDLAINNISSFHESQLEKKKIIETTKGVLCWRENRPISSIGIYIPGGSAPLFSTVLMLGIPAKIAGCKEVVLCTPPNSEGKIDPTILYVADLIGITKIYKVGGIQAIAAMTFGTESILKVDKLFGPGNQYVTAAKKAVLNYGVAIDMPAGPSEVLVIADQSANASFVASDLLSQAEHGADSQVFLLTTDEALIQNALDEIQKQTELLPRKKIVLEALKNSSIILLKSLDECIDFSNNYAPEHLILAVDNPEKLINKIDHAGSVFLGNYSCESLGDYASGTNHTLPTNGFAKNYSGVSLDSFVKKITFQQVSFEGLQNIGPSVELMAEAEQLLAHKNAVSIRLKR
jgi:histidinol dehydrogenase